MIGRDVSVIVNMTKSGITWDGSLSKELCGLGWLVGMHVRDLGKLRLENSPCGTIFTG